VLAGGLVAVVGPASVLGLDAASYAVSMVAVLSLPAAVRAAEPRERTGFVTELREGWSEFTARPWLWLTSAQMGLFNLLVWAPFLVLGPVVAQGRLGGASAWGLVMACYGTGSVVGGALLLGRRPRRPVLLATVAALGWALPSAALGSGRPLPWVCAAALVAGVGSAVYGTLYATTIQRQVPAAARARVNAYGTFGAFVMGPLGLAAAGPCAALLGADRVLGAGAVWQLASVLVALTLPAIRIAFPAAGDDPPAPAPREMAHGDATSS
jgi:Major Facilitator Superfamily